MKNKLAVIFKKSITFIKLLHLNAFKYLSISILLFSSVNILPLITAINDSNKVDAQAIPPIVGTPQWGTYKGSYTREAYQNAPSVTSPSEKWRKSVADYGLPGVTTANGEWSPQYIGIDGTVYAVIHSTVGNWLMALNKDSGALKTGVAPLKLSYTSCTGQVITGDYIIHPYTTDVTISIKFNLEGIAPNGDLVTTARGNKVSSPTCPNYNSITHPELDIQRFTPTASGFTKVYENKVVNGIANETLTGPYETQGLSPNGSKVIVGLYQTQVYTLMPAQAGAPTVGIQPRVQNNKTEYAYTCGTSTCWSTRGCGISSTGSTDPLCHDNTVPGVAFSSDGKYAYTEENFYNNVSNPSTGPGANVEQFDLTSSAEQWIPSDNNQTHDMVNTKLPILGQNVLISTGSRGKIFTFLPPNNARITYMVAPVLGDKVIAVDKINNYLYTSVGGNIRRIRLGEIIQNNWCKASGLPYGDVNIGGKTTRVTNCGDKINPYNSIPYDEVGAGSALYYLQGAAVSNQTVNSSGVTIKTGSVYYTQRVNSGQINFVRKPFDSPATTSFTMSLPSKSAPTYTEYGQLAVGTDGSTYINTGTHIVALGTAVPMTCTGSTVTFSPNPVNVANPATPGSFTATATGINNAETVTFPTWSTTAGQNDLVWWPGTKVNANTWQAVIPLNNHILGNGDSGYNVGQMNVHVYASNSITANTFCTAGTFNINQSPTGLVNINTCTNIQGYAFDRDNTTAQISVKINIYKGITAASGILATNTVLASVGDRTTHVFTWNYPQDVIRDGNPHLFEAIALDPINSALNTSLPFNVGVPSTLTCDPNGWVTVNGAQTNSYSSYQNSVTGNSINRPGVSTPWTTGFNNSIVTTFSTLSNFFNASAGNVVTTYRSNIINNYKDANDKLPGAPWGRYTFQPSSPQSSVPTNNTLIKKDDLSTTAACNQAGNVKSGLTFDPASTTVNVNLSCVNTELQRPYYINLMGTSGIKVAFLYNLDGTAASKKNGLAFYVIGANNVVVNVATNAVDRDDISVLIATNSDITVNSMKNKNGLLMDGLNYFNMGLVSSNNITYNCNGYDSVNAPDVAGCRTIQRGFTFAEGKVNLTYKNTTDMGAYGVKNLPSLEVNYSPYYAYDFANQPSNTSYDFTTDFLGFDY